MLKFTTALTSFAVSMAAANSQVLDTDSVLTFDLGHKLTRNNLEKIGTHVEQGKSVRFEIDGNATTGYEWFYVEKASNGAFQIERTYIPDTPQTPE